MPKMRKITIKEENDIINLYSNQNVGIEKLCERFNVGKVKIKDILKKYEVPIKKRGGQVVIGNSSEIEGGKSSFYKANKGKKLVAICKKTGISYQDINNLSGILTTHIIKEYEDVEIPNNTYQRKKYESINGKKWFEEYFNIVEIDDEVFEYKKCPYCDWQTKDIKNLSGQFEIHLKNEHNLTIQEYLTKNSSDKDYFKNLRIFEDVNKYVTCCICGKKMLVLSNTHLHKHNISATEYKLKYGGKIMNDSLTKKTVEQLFEYNLNGLTKGKPSKPELEIGELIKNLNIDYRTGDRQLLNGKEIDIIIPDKNIGIEYNGNIHHTQWFGGKDPSYHLNKTTLANSNGYGLIHIFSDEWVNKKDLVLVKIKHLLGVNDGIKIGGRSCIIKEILTKTKDDFLEKYHIQGKDSSTIKLGGFFNEELVGVMTFKLIKNGEYELTRFATNYNYITQGLASKILSYFKKKYTPNNIISFADRRWTIDGCSNLYTKLGFKLVKILKPDYKYYNVNDSKENRYHKFGFRKKILLKKYGNILNSDMTETEMVKIIGYDRIWDCGLFKYELIGDNYGL